MLKKLSLPLLTLVVIAGCASDPPKTTQAPPALNIPTLTPTGRSLALNNGYAYGIWMINCKSQSKIKQEITNNENYIGFNLYEDGKLIEVSKIYEVSSLAKGVINVKSLASGATGDYISLQKVGFTGGKRMLFDSTSIFLTGSNKSEELISVKDGYQVSKAPNGALIKIKPMPTFEKCD